MKTVNNQINVFTASKIAVRGLAARVSGGGMRQRHLNGTDSELEKCLNNAHTARRARQIFQPNL